MSDQPAHIFYVIVVDNYFALYNMLLTDFNLHYKCIHLIIVVTYCPVTWTILIIFWAGFTVFELAGCSHHSESESLLKEKRKGRCWAFVCEFVGVIFLVCLHSTEAKPESLNGFM